MITYTGPCPRGSLGFTLAREHLALNRAALYHAGSEAAAIGQVPLALGILGDVRRKPYASLSNLQLNVKDAGPELTRFRRAAEAFAGSTSSVTVVETTPRGWRTPEDLCALAKLAVDCPTIRLVLGTGCVAALEQATAASDLSALFVRDLKEGFSCSPGGAASTVASAVAPQGYALASISSQSPVCHCWLIHTGVYASWCRRAGLIGEIILTGGAAAFGPADLTVLEAAANAQRETGAALMLIVPPDRDTHYVSRLLSEQLSDRFGLGTSAFWCHQQLSHCWHV